ncbi:MAG: DUF3365 domain-containing protein [Chitinophagales bacterium]|nr:DUF3365 domain-containing protein [Bacteroidota bacterium]MCB9043790.1 DUF3365 domain-containing protein [Chitinophagales bacterium]
MKKIAFSILLFSVLIIGCQQQKSTENAPTPTENTSVKQNANDAAAYDILKTNCFSCHSPNPEAESRIAPNMAAVKKAYLSASSDLDAFKQQFVTFLRKPDKENAKMTDAVQKYGLMPAMTYSEEQLNLIAEYIYQTPIENSDWYKNAALLQNASDNGAEAKENPLAYGQSLAMKTKAVLGKNLLEAINTQGTENALKFCSTKAYPLTDSMAVALNAHIKRVSDKNRNPQNKANEAELQYITATKLALQKGEEPKGSIREENGKMIGYYPITTNKMCLQCHGNIGSDILPATQQTIQQLYPQDKATGYGENELRGIWVVEFEAK